MRLILLIAIILFKSNSFAQYAAENIELLGHWKNDTLDYTTLQVHYNSVWGWHDQNKKREYAILGGNDGAYFIEVTDPKNPVLRDFVKGRRSNCTWREYKNYGNYLYLISDDAPPNSFQIVDMSYLPDSVHRVYDSDSLFVTAHTLFIDKDKLYCASVKTKFNQHYPIGVYSLSDPSNPVLLKNLRVDYPFIQQVHDMYVRNDTVYASAAYQGLHVFHFDEYNFFNPLGSLISYPGAGYNHSSWLTDNGKTMVFCDEVPANLPVKVIDVSDLSDITVKATFKSNEGATAHNPYILGNDFVVIAYYEDGVYIYDIKDPENPKVAGYFDTHPQNNNTYMPPANTYNGCWGAYPYLPSRNILVSDRQNGLFILDASKIIGKPQRPYRLFKTYFSYDNHLVLEPSEAMNGEYLIQVFDISGKSVIVKNLTLLPGSKERISVDTVLSTGIYIVKITGKSTGYTQKLLKF
jgi:choice-of-anchor B domain-containing protein